MQLMAKKKPAKDCRKIVKSKKKTYKSQDMSRCCGKCSNCNKTNAKDHICSLSGENVNDDDVCDKCDTTVHGKCQRCGADIKFQDKSGYYNSVVRFSMEGAISSGQNIHLCKKCMTEAWEMFGDLLDAIKHGRNFKASKIELDHENMSACDGEKRG